MVHPLDGFDVQGVNIKCFDENGSGFFRFSPITVVIGKNNSGKSTVVDILDICTDLKKKAANHTSQQRSGAAIAIDLRQELTEDMLALGFRKGTRGGHIQNDHFEFGTANFLGQLISSRITYRGGTELLSIPDLSGFSERQKGEISQYFLKCCDWSLDHHALLRVAAERSVSPETSTPPKPEPTGSGVTNLIRHFINSDSQPRDVVEVELLSDLNRIYAGDSAFTSIVCQENEGAKTWEIFLREDGKSDVRLSESGSSLQSAFIILSFLRLVPLLQNVDWTRLILVVEEPENNLHPALLRRLLEFLAMKREELGFSLVMTTHSPVCIDWATRREDAGIVHVKRDGDRSVCENVMDYEGNMQILDDLDVRGSDLLQSNGIIWVEGPSDRIYIKTWIDLMSDGALIEGAHYSFMYYGGKVLSHFQALPESELSPLLSMVTVNRNVAIVMDSDRKMKPGSTRKPAIRINDTKRRVRDEIDNHGGMVWITAGKEIENYIPQSVWQILVGADFDLAHEFVDIPKDPRVEAVKSAKVALAHKVAPLITRDSIANHLDLTAKVEELITHIRRWNAID